MIAGTSAGASALASHMMAFGQPGATPRHGNVQTAAGLGLVEGTIVDQHFEQRTRLGRLLSAIGQSPSLIGLGLDEDTCAIVHSNRAMEVIGRGAVSVVDGSHMETDAYRLRGRRPMMVSGAQLHSIPVGLLVRPAGTNPDPRRRGSRGERSRGLGVTTTGRPATPKRSHGDAEAGEGEEARAQAGGDRFTPRATGPADRADPGLPGPELLLLRPGDPARRRPRLARVVAVEHDPRLHRPSARAAARCRRALLLPGSRWRLPRAPRRGHVGGARRGAHRDRAAARVGRAGLSRARRGAPARPASTT